MGSIAVHLKWGMLIALVGYLLSAHAAPAAVRDANGCDFEHQPLAGTHWSNCMVPHGLLGLQPVAAAENLQMNGTYNFIDHAGSVQGLSGTIIDGIITEQPINHDTDYDGPLWASYGFFASDPTVDRSSPVLVANLSVYVPSGGPDDQASFKRSLLSDPDAARLPVIVEDSADSFRVLPVITAELWSDNYIRAVVLVCAWSSDTEQPESNFAARNLPTSCYVEPVSLPAEFAYNWPEGLALTDMQAHVRYGQREHAGDAPRFNITLRVTATAENGFHNVEYLMRSWLVSLGSGPDDKPVVQTLFDAIDGVDRASGHYSYLGCALACPACLERTRDNRSVVVAAKSGMHDLPLRFDTPQLAVSILGWNNQDATALSILADGTMQWQTTIFPGRQLGLVQSAPHFAIFDASPRGAVLVSLLFESNQPPDDDKVIVDGDIYAVQVGLEKTGGGAWELSPGLSWLVEEYGRLEYASVLTAPANPAGACIGNGGIDNFKDCNVTVVILGGEHVGVHSIQRDKQGFYAQTSSARLPNGDGWGAEISSPGIGALLQPEELGAQKGLLRGSCGPTGSCVLTAYVSLWANGSGSYDDESGTLGQGLLSLRIVGGAILPEGAVSILPQDFRGYRGQVSPIRNGSIHFSIDEQDAIFAGAFRRVATTSTPTPTPSTLPSPTPSSTPSQSAMPSSEPSSSLAPEPSQTPAVPSTSSRPTTGPKKSNVMRWAVPLGIACFVCLVVAGVAISYWMRGTPTSGDVEGGYTDVHGGAQPLLTPARVPEQQPRTDDRQLAAAEADSSTLLARPGSVGKEQTPLLSSSRVSGALNQQLLWPIDGRPYDIEPQGAQSMQRGATCDGGEADEADDGDDRTQADDGAFSVAAAATLVLSAAVGLVAASGR